MIAQFKCLDCEKEFVQHVSTYAECPVCGSVHVTGAYNWERERENREQLKTEKMDDIWENVKKRIEAFIDQKLRDGVD